MDGKTLAQDESLRIFYPLAHEGHARAKESNQLFAHYVSASVAQSILEKSEFWMRNALAQNDYAEIEYGRKMLRHAFQSELGSSFFVALDKCHQGLGQEVRAEYESPNFQHLLATGTFIACITKHHESEAGLGRLSMWRAYGGKHPVAVIFSQNALVRPEANPGVFVQPVHYAGEEDFRQELVRTTERIFDAAAQLSSVPRSDVMNFAIGSLVAKVTCTKHPGFREESEWRLVMSSLYGTNLASSRFSVEKIGDAPQMIYKGNLGLSGTADFTGMSMEAAIHQIIIGPCAQPNLIKEVLVNELSKQGVEKPWDRVVISDIPLRRE